MRSFIPAIATGLALASLVLAASAQDIPKQAGLDVGARAPRFESVDAAGQVWKSADHAGKRFIVVYFYPGDFTPGCTAQARKFQENMKRLHEYRAEVVGVSGDSRATHALFKDTYQLNYMLIADEKGELARKFGVPVGPGAQVKTTLSDKTRLNFKREVTTARWTFIIGLDGKVVYKNTKVDPVKDSQQVEAFLKDAENK